MKNKIKESIPIFIAIYCLIFIPIFLYKYSFYLQKPDGYAWESIKKYLIDSKKYNQEPIVFNPDWFSNYATDYSRFQKFNVVKHYQNFNNYWLISMDKKSIPKNYRIIDEKEISYQSKFTSEEKKIFIFKLKK